MTANGGFVAFWIAFFSINAYCFFFRWAAKPPEEVEAVERKRRAKRYNEQAKLGATFFNNASLAGSVTGLLAPVTAGSQNITWGWYVTVLTASLILQVFAQSTLRLWRSEE